MVSRCYLLLKGTRANSRVKVGKLKVEAETSCARVKRIVKDQWGCVRRIQRSPRSGSYWSNLEQFKHEKNNIITNYDSCIEIEFDEKRGIYKISKYFPHKILLNYQGKKSNFTAEKPGRQDLMQLIKLNVTNNGTRQNCSLPPDRMQ